MHPIFGFLTLALSASLAAGSPLLPAGSTPSPTANADDLIEMARWQFDSERDTSIHYHPYEAIVIDEDTNLAGTWIVDSFEVQIDATAVATSDLTVVARRFIGVEGKILGAHRLEHGASILLRSFGTTAIHGVIEAGDGMKSESTETNRAAPGGDIWMSGIQVEFGGTAKAGAGAHGGAGVDGANGGDVLTLCQDSIHYVSGLRATGVIGGRGGNGGPAPGPGLEGMSGGDGGSVGDFASLRSAVGRGFKPHILLDAPAFATVLATFAPVARHVPEQAGCPTGTNGSDAGDATAGSGTPMPSYTPSFAAAGQDGQPGAAPNEATTKVGGAGGDGGVGGTGPLPKGDGGKGGAAGAGGDAFGGNGQSGQSGGSGCGEPSGIGGSGGKGGTGGKGEGGTGGNGGPGGRPSGDCHRGIDRSGGVGGSGSGGVGGLGGSIGSSYTSLLNNCYQNCPTAGKGGDPGTGSAGLGGLDGSHIRNDVGHEGEIDDLPDQATRGPSGGVIPTPPSTPGGNSTPC